MQSSPGTFHSRRRGFSLIELLTVIAIIMLILAIVFPVLATVRRTARTADTKNLMVNFLQGVTRFQTDKARLPGYFSAKEMGSSDNRQVRGFSSMQNIMLDLSGGVAPAGSTAPEIVDAVGPLSDPAQQIKVNPTLIGSGTKGSKAYYQPPARNLRLQDGSEGGDRFGVTANKRVPELVDAFQTPILAWRIDETFVSPIKTIGDFVADTSTTPSRFYWGQNAAFLSTAATSVGRERINMGDQSLIGGGNASGSPGGFIHSLGGFLGSPSSPLNLSAAVTNAKDLLPAAARGTIVLHSAGENAIFLGRSGIKNSGKDRPGGDLASTKTGADANCLYYGFNYFRPSDSGADTRRADESGANTSTDLLVNFDDLVMSGG